MSNLLKRIANYFTNEYDGDDKTAPKMELQVDELRYIASMNVDRCRAEAELRELKNKRYSRTNADRIRSFSDEELADFMYAKDIPWCNDSECPTETLCKDCFRKWLQQEVE